MLGIDVELWNAASMIPGCLIAYKWIEDGVGEMASVDAGLAYTFFCMCSVAFHLTNWSVGFRWPMFKLDILSQLWVCFAMRPDNGFWIFLCACMVMITGNKAICHLSSGAAILMCSIESGLGTYLWLITFAIYAMEKLFYEPRLHMWFHIVGHLAVDATVRDVLGGCGGVGGVTPNLFL